MAPRPSRFIPALNQRWLTPLYDPLIRRTVRELEFKQELVRQARIRPGHRVLDLGCGTATLTILVKRSHPDAAVIGLDADPEVLAIASRKVAAAGVAITLDQGTASALPYPSVTFDRVLSSLVFHHLTRDDKHASLREILRVLRPGGELHIADFGAPRSAPMRWVSWVMRRLEETADNFDGLLPSFMRMAGFHDVEETMQFATVFGPVSLYRASTPAS